MQISGKINHTGRRKIKHSEVQINIRDGNGSLPDFTASFSITDKKISNDADLYVEAYHKNTSQRFNFGTVGSPIRPQDTTLNQIDLSGPILFRVKAVDNSSHVGRLVASAEGLRSQQDLEDEQRASLMIFKSTPDLGQLPWKISFAGDDKPVLCINSNIREAKEQLLHNPLFQSLILPAAFREVLMFILWDREEEPDDGTWQQDWMNFATLVGPEEPDGEADPFQYHNWIDDVVSEFSKKHELCDLLIKRMELIDEAAS